MDRSKRDDRTTPQVAPPGSEGGKVLKFMPRAPRLAFVECGSGWYHQSAIDVADQGAGPKR